MELWSDFDPGIVNPSAIGKCLPDMFVLMALTTIESLLELARTKSQLKCEMDMDREVFILGYQNLVSTAFVSTPGYSQVKFSALTSAIVGGTTERKPGYVVAALCAFVYLGGFPIINFISRFLLGGLLVYAAMPFVDKHLVCMCRVTKEFIAIWTIVLVNAIVGFYTPAALLIAVVFGILMAAIIFMIQYSKVSVIRDVLSGQEFQSVVVRQYSEEKLLSRLGVRFKIIELQGYVFFGTANQVLDNIKSIVAHNNQPQNFIS